MTARKKVPDLPRLVFPPQEPQGDVSAPKNGSIISTSLHLTGKAISQTPSSLVKK
jgi:hypothetical protein